MQKKSTERQKKIRVMVLYGGRSGEHEISLRSAASVIRYLDPEAFEVVPVAIDKQGKWRLNDLSLMEKSAAVLPVYKDAPSVVMLPHPHAGQSELVTLDNPALSSMVDVIFPVMHGPLCEDGAIQGLLELADIPYVGSGVLASAMGMDKDITKRLTEAGGIPTVPYLALKKEKWETAASFLKEKIAQDLGFPVFVKPANLGSSVGVHKVKEAGALEAAIEDAFRYDVKILVEKGLSIREIEVAVLEDLDPKNPPRVSTPGEIVPTHEFYSYEAKYLDEEGAKLKIPAQLSATQITEAQNIAVKAFQLLECEGLARVDLFLDKDSGKFYFNELNTMPGFTSISMYPKMWEYSGIPYPKLLSHLIELGIRRHGRKSKLVRDYNE